MKYHTSLLLVLLLLFTITTSVEEEDVQNVDNSEDTEGETGCGEQNDHVAGCGCGHNSGDDNDE